MADGVTGAVSTQSPSELFKKEGVKPEIGPQFWMKREREMTGLSDGDRSVVDSCEDFRIGTNLGRDWRPDKDRVKR